MPVLVDRCTDWVRYALLWIMDHLEGNSIAVALGSWWVQLLQTAPSWSQQTTLGSPVIMTLQYSMTWWKLTAFSIAPPVGKAPCINHPNDWLRLEDPLAWPQNLRGSLTSLCTSGGVGLAVPSLVEAVCISLSPFPLSCLLEISLPHLVNAPLA